MDFAVKVVQQLLRFSNCRFDYSKELPLEQILSGRVWDKIVSIQYNLYSRLDRGAMIAGNAMLLLQLRAMFVALVTSVKADLPGAVGANRRAPQNMGRVWLSTTSYFVWGWANGDVAKSMQAPKDFGFKECTLLRWVETDDSFGWGFVGVCSMVNGLPCLCNPRASPRRQRSPTKAL